MANNINIESNLTFARQVLEMEKASVAIVKSHNLLTLKGDGIEPILNALAQDVECFIGAAVAVSNLGKAAALLLMYGQVGAIFANSISIEALDLLTVNKIALTYITKRVQLFAPQCLDYAYEIKTENIDDPTAAYNILKL